MCRFYSWGHGQRHRRPGLFVHGHLGVDRREAAAELGRELARITAEEVERKKLGWDKDPVKGNYSCYTCRHTFAHRMLSGYWTNGVGCSIETLAELIGDTPKVAFDHFGREWGAALSRSAVGGDWGGCETSRQAEAGPICFA